VSESVNETKQLMKVSGCLSQLFEWIRVSSPYIELADLEVYLHDTIVIQCATSRIIVDSCRCFQDFLASFNASPLRST